MESPLLAKKMKNTDILHQFCWLNNHRTLSVYLAQLSMFKALSCFTLKKLHVVALLAVHHRQADGETGAP